MWGGRREKGRKGKRKTESGREVGKEKEGRRELLKV